MLNLLAKKDSEFSGQNKNPLGIALDFLWSQRALWSTKDQAAFLFSLMRSNIPEANVEFVSRWFFSLPVEEQLDESQGIAAYSLFHVVNFLRYLRNAGISDDLRERHWLILSSLDQVPPLVCSG